MKKKGSPTSPKAYNDLQFLNGPDARTLRILSEYLEPAARFKKEGVKDAIVFFGSARVLPPPEARKRLKAAKARIAEHKHPSKHLTEVLQKAEIDMQMSHYYKDAFRLSTMLTRWSHTQKNSHRFAICSGGGPGIMEAANRGALIAGGKSIGLNISLPHEQGSNAFISHNLNLEFHYFFMRKLWFMQLACALVMFPGGYGTMDEMLEAFTLLQTKKVEKRLPIILYGREYWNQVINFDFLVKSHTISKEDLKLFHFADTPEEAFEHLKTELSKHYLKNENF